MIHQDSKEFIEIIRTSTALRGTKQFLEAISLIERQIDKMHPDCLANAYREIFQAAKEGGLTDKVRTVAKILNELEPGLPSVQSYLK